MGNYSVVLKTDWCALPVSYARYISTVSHGQVLNMTHKTFTVHKNWDSLVPRPCLLAEWKNSWDRGYNQDIGLMISVIPHILIDVCAV